MIEVDSHNGVLTLRNLPSICPFCHKSILPIPLFGHKKNLHESEIFMMCPDSNCKASFIGYFLYNFSDSSESYCRTMRGRIVDKPFSETIESVSPQFGKIYNQAFQAEQLDLFEICGVGYRKSLEFLIKDYAILKHPIEKETIEKKMLGACIKDYVTDSRVRSVATRAAWLGNDETHYVRKWEGQNLNDLKKLIDLTLHWIEMEKLTESFEEEMPD